MGEAALDRKREDQDGNELHYVIEKSKSINSQVDGEEQTAEVKSATEPTIDVMSLAGLTPNKGDEAENPLEEIEQTKDDALESSAGCLRFSSDPKEPEGNETSRTAKPNVGAGARSLHEEQLEEDDSQAELEEEEASRLLREGPSKSKSPQKNSLVNEPTEEKSKEGSLPEEGARPQIEYFCAPNQTLTSDAWKILFFHMLPFTTVPPVLMLACLWWAYIEWGWSALLFYTTILALLTFSTPVYSRRVREAVTDYMYVLLARYVPSAQYVVPEKPFPERRAYIFACHPHGRMFYSTIIFCQLHRTWRKRILQGGDLFMTAAGMFFFVPLLRNLFYLIGVIPVEEEDIVAKLRQKDHVTILVGGVKEVLLGTEADADHIYLKRRKGFCRIAIEQNAGVVPVYFFNENQMFKHNSISFLKFWESVNKYVKVGVPFMRGRLLILPMPFRRPLMIAVGDPLFARAGESVDDLHQRYMKALRELFDRYVPYSPQPNHKLIIE